MGTVNKALILAGGLGTRMLPASKAVPKEMFAIVDKPLIQYAVEEAVAAGIDEVVLVLADGKESIVEHFSRQSRVEVVARQRGDDDLLARAEEPARLATFAFVRQDEPKGIAHAVACARHLLEGGPFGLMFPDDLILSRKPCMAQLVEAYDACDGSVIAVQQVAPEEIPQYGIVDPAESGNPMRLKGMVEKPAAADAPSSLGIVGRYVLSPTIFDHIDRIPRGKNDELQITDALASQIAAGETVCALQYEGRRFDTGRPLGLVVATVAAALAREDLAAPLARKLDELLRAEQA